MVEETEKLIAARGAVVKGFLLALVAAACWGVLPVTLKWTVEQMDAQSVTFYRFLVATLLLISLNSVRKNLKQVVKLERGQVVWLILGALGLSGNYVFYLLGVQKSSPQNAQVMIQAAPMLFAVTSAIWFREKVEWKRGVAFLVLLAGLFMFFRDQIHATSSVTEWESYQLGSALVILSAIFWVFYAMAQKIVLRTLSPMTILVIMFFCGTIVSGVFSSPLSIAELDGVHFLALMLCCANTIVAYGAFALALQIMDGSRVSVVISLSPVLTIGITSLLSGLFPEKWHVHDLSILGWFGAIAVVGASISASLLGRRESRVATVEATRVAS